MLRYWISDGCFYALLVLAVVGCSALLRIATPLPEALIAVLAMAIVYAINYAGERATRGID